MAVRLDYVAKETVQNLARNFMLVLATVIVVAISLTLVGAAQLSRYAVENAFVKWNNDVEFIVYLKAEADATQIEGVQTDLSENPQVDEFEYYDSDETYDLFKKIFAQDDPDLVESIKKEDLPTSFQVKPKNPDADVVRNLAKTFQDKAGVYDVEFPDEQVRQVQQAAETLNQVLYIVAAVLLLSSSMLILVAIQMAVFARRREVEVMRLVGATNWYVRLPFVFEGVLQGLVGGGLATLLVWIMSSLVSSRISQFSRGSLLGRLVWEQSELYFTLGLITGTGVVVGAVSALVSVSFYLRG